QMLRIVLYFVKSACFTRNESKRNGESLKLNIKQWLNKARGMNKFRRSGHDRGSWRLDFFLAPVMHLHTNPDFFLNLVAQKHVIHLPIVTNNGDFLKFLQIAHSRFCFFIGIST